MSAIGTISRNLTVRTYGEIRIHTPTDEPCYDHDVYSFVRETRARFKAGGASTGKPLSVDNRLEHHHVSEEDTRLRTPGLFSARAAEDRDRAVRSTLSCNEGFPNVHLLLSFQVEDILRFIGSDMNVSGDLGFSSRTDSLAMIILTCGSDLNVPRAKYTKLLESIWLQARLGINNTW